MRAFKIALSVICLQFLTVIPVSLAASPAGTASIVAGAVSAVAADGSSRLLSKNDAVYSGDRIITGSAAYVRLGFLDGSSMVLRPNTEFAIESFRFNPGIVDATVKAAPVKPDLASVAATPVPALQIADQGEAIGSQALFRLVRGGFRAVSGLVGKLNREEYAVRTAVATIGIRGTLYWGLFCDAACTADVVVQGAVPVGESALGGVVSAVEQGAIEIVSISGKTVVVMPGQFVLTTLSGTHVLLPGPPGFIGGEDWLNAAQQAGSSPSVAAAGGPSSTLANATLLTTPTIGGLAAAVIIGVTILSEDDGNAAPTSTTR